jgi:predicted nucleic acid-binding protein
VILVDTSVWIAHLRWQLPDLAALLSEQKVLAHPLVIGELACGPIRNRTVILQFLSELPSAVLASNDEVLRLIEDRQLWGKGIGLVDFHLLASAALTGCRFWASDLRLNETAAELGLDWRSKPQ